MKMAKLKIDDNVDFLEEEQVQAQTAAGKSVSINEREIQCMKWCAEGRSPKEIAEILSLSEWTVKFYITAVKKKLGAKTCAHCIALAIRQKLI